MEKKLYYQFSDGAKFYQSIMSLEGLDNICSDFKSGVEFAQRWIDVKDELPRNRELVLAKVLLIN